MRRTAKPVIVIPVYKNIDDWKESEIQSFSRCIKILIKHPIILTGPKQLKWKVLLASLYNRFGFRFSIETFDDIFFENIDGYNKLLKSYLFYNRFRNYSHLLIYQLDAYVFRDELIKWCKSGYDYIGAPWFENYHIGDNSITGVGNGGFSLRNINRSLSLLYELRTVEVLEKYKSFNTKGIIPRLLIIFKEIVKSYKLPSQIEANLSINEDVFWSQAVPKQIKKFSCQSLALKVLAAALLKRSFVTAPFESAVKFSFEMNPKLLYKMNSNKLPFGCHAWEKYDPEFWSPFISQGKKNCESFK